MLGADVPRRGEGAVGSGSPYLVRRHVPLVELDLLDAEHAGPAGLVSESVRAPLGVLLAEKRSIAPESPGSPSAYTRIGTKRIAVRPFGPLRSATATDLTRRNRRAIGRVAAHLPDDPAAPLTSAVFPLNPVARAYDRRRPSDYKPFVQLAV